MYNILFLGQDIGTFSRLRDSLPRHMRLEPEHEIVNLSRAIRSVKPHGIVLPISNPGPEEFSILKKVIDTPRVPGVIVTSDYLTVAQAVSCMRFGAYDCLTGPMNYDAVGACLNRMILPVKPPENTGKYPGEDLLAGNSPAVISLRQRLIKYSDLSFPVLITGETGSGKDLAAKTIHLHSPRKNQPFVTINCASYPEDLLTTEMFGSHKGAFTGSTDRPGLFESADKGTLFLDEIGELSIHSQGSLLRVIEDGYIRRIGSFKTKKVNVRIIAATNRNLRQCMKEGTFRSDLFYRLNLLGVSVPPLRRRKEDIPVLARNYLMEIQQESPLTLENAALTLLTRYNWPGNVRELQSVLLRASLYTERGKIRKSDICLPDPDNDVSFNEEL